MAGSEPDRRPTIKSALVTGATGMIGRRVVSLLNREGIAVRAHARAASPAACLEGTNVPLFRCEIDDTRALSAAADGVECILHVAGALSMDAPFTVGDAQMRELYRRVNVDFTARLLDIAQALGIRRFVYCSSVAVYAQSAQSPISEDAPVRPPSDYGASKRDAEALVLSKTHKGMETAIVRPCITVGAGDRHVVGALKALARQPLLPIPGGPSYRVDIANVDDIADVLYRCAICPVAAGRIYNATSDAPIRIADLIAGLSDRFSAGKVVSIPYSFMRTWAPALRTFLNWTAPDAARLLSPIAMEYLRREFIFDVSRARRELGFVPRGLVKEAIDAALCSRG